MASEIRVNKINTRAGLGTITIADTGVVVNGIVTCTEVSGLNVLNIAGVSTFANTLDINGDIDVDGHTNLDNVSIAGVTTFSGSINVANGTISRTSTGNKLIFQNDLEMTQNVNKLLLIGYYLINLGATTITITLWDNVESIHEMISTFSSILGKTILLLVIFHYNNIFWIKFLNRKKQTFN